MSRAVRAAADLVRVAGVVSFAIGVSRGFIATALFALVLLGLTLLRVTRVPAGLDLGAGALMVVAAWFALLDYYLRYSWLDVAVHVVATGLVAGAAYAALVRVGVVHPPDDPTLPRARLGVVLVTVALGGALGVLWEGGEWFGHTYLDPSIQIGYDDTIGDLFSGGLGALLAGLYLARRHR